MKRVLFLLPGVVAVIFAAAPMIPGFHNAAVASPAHAGEGHSEMDKLNLTSDQKAQIKQIHQSAKQQIDAILTPEQKAQQQQARQQHTKPQLNLSADQKRQLKQIRESTESQINALLTPQQQQQLQQMHAQHHQQHSS